MRARLKAAAKELLILTAILVACCWPVLIAVTAGLVALLLKRMGLLP